MSTLEPAMDVTAIVYTSKHGHTKKYADLLAKKFHLPAYTPAEAAKALREDERVIYLGWMRKAKIMGLVDALQRYRVCCAVGMMPMGGMANEETRKQNAIAQDIAVFYLQGGFCYNDTSGMDRFIMKTVKRGIIPMLENKVHPEPDEACMIRMFREGANCVSIDNLKEVIAWYRGRETADVTDD